MFVANTAIGQLVNIESRRMQTDSIRFVLKNDFALSYNDNNGKYIYQISNGLSTQLKSKDLRKIFLLLGNYNIIRTKDTDFRNSWFLHFRVNYKLSNLFRVESFAQSQYDKLLDVNSRNLLGAGVRFKLVSKENLKLYIANAYMYEVERSDEFATNYFNHRNSSYLSLTWHFPKSKITLLNTTYYQPLYKDFNDFRFLEQFKAEYEVSKNLKLFTLYNYYYDSVTPKDRAQYTSNVKFGLSVNL